MRAWVGSAVVCVALAVLLGVVMNDRQPVSQRHVSEVARSSSEVRRAADRPMIQPPRGWGQLAAAINRAQRVIDDRLSNTRELAAAGLFEQLATGSLAREPARAREATLGRLGGSAAASMRANLDAADALSGLSVPRTGLPRWRIVSPPSPAALRRYFALAQRRSGVRWQYLAAIELVESRFGRIVGSSPAGARGPMQFMPGTWAQYGRGSIYDQRGSILAAARLLAAAGARRDMAGALYRYNNSPLYVRAVSDYAKRMRADPRAYYGYYYWQVLYSHRGGTVILPVGYPRARPIPVP